MESDYLLIIVQFCQSRKANVLYGVPLLSSSLQFLQYTATQVHSE